MKTGIIERTLILLAFNLYKIATVFFAISLIVVVLCYSLFNEVPLVVGYIFWFSLGVFGFSLAIRKATLFLEKKYKENNDYYLDLLAKHKKHTSSRLRVTYRKAETNNPPK